MRKILIGCSMVLLVGLIAGSIFMYRGCYLPIQENKADLTLVAMLGSYNDQITNKAPFTPPVDDLLSPDQLRRFVAVQREVQNTTDTSFTKVRDRVANFEKSVKEEPTKYIFNVGRMMSVFKGLGPDMTHVKVAQVAALNHQGFSLAEYRWVREAVLRAMGRDVRSPLEGITGESKDSRPPVVSRTESERRIPAGNVALVRATGDTLNDWIPISVLGW